MKSLILLAALGPLVVVTFGAEGQPTPPTQVAPATPAVVPQTPPTLANVAYGTHARQVLDFWRAKSATPTPVLFHIHGGGWVAGDKAVVADLDRYLAAGISVVSINYRFVTQAIDANVKPPVQWPLEDAARALQFVRSKAREWNLDKVRVIATGSSAGACSSLYLAFHAEMAEPKSSDPIARESTRLESAAVFVAQTTLDPQQMIAWTPNSRYGGHAFGLMPDTKDLTTRDTQFAEFLAAREKLLPWIKKYSPWEHATSDDPPIYLLYRTPPAMGQEEKDPTHTANFGVKLQEHLRTLGVPCELVYPGATAVKHEKISDYVTARLKPGGKR
ncbi:MAG: alpha/beta hydrolase [Opitutus sp.]|nr:alpha/beta hydrolase [Opitutus sp.]